jgi:putative ABC transport system permease protein
MNSVGEIISIPTFYDLKVAGIFYDLPYQTHLKTNFIASFHLIEFANPQTLTWSSNTYYNYLLMPHDFNRKDFNEKMDAFIDKYTPASWSTYEYFLQPVREISLQPFYVGNAYGTLGRLTIIEFNIVGFIILFLACLNYVNLATARSISRSQEVGIRKVMGAFRTQLIMQFLVESFILCTCGLLLALLWADFMVPAFNAFSGYSLKLSSYFTDPILLGYLATALLSLTVLAGGYPALLLSSYLPIAVLKGQNIFDTSKRMRSTLVVTQFAFTTTLVVFAVVVFKQTKFIREYDLGFKKDQMLFFYADRNKEISLESFKAEFYKIPGVTRLSNTSTHPSSRMSTTSLWHAGRESDESIKIEWILADHDYIPALELELVAGKNFNSNGINTNNVIINEKAAAALGWTPEEAIGKKVVGFTFRDSLPGEIVGVIKDFHIATLRKEINPLVIAYDINNTGYAVSLEGENLIELKTKVDAATAKFTHGENSESIFMEDALELSYQGEKKTGQLLSIFTIIAIILGCSGLYALSAYEGERKIKELGIRKIMGANTSQLIILLSRHLIKPVAISLFVALPVAYFIANFWLRGYAYRIPWSIDIFIWSAVGILLIGWITILTQVVKASRLNPTDALRYE